MLEGWAGRRIGGVLEILAFVLLIRLCAKERTCGATTTGFARMTSVVLASGIDVSTLCLGTNVFELDDKKGPGGTTIEGARTLATLGLDGLSAGDLAAL